MRVVKDYRGCHEVVKVGTLQSNWSSEYLHIYAWISPTPTGLKITLRFYNNNSQKNVEICYPIVGHMEYIDEFMEPKRTIVGSLYYLWVSTDSGVFKGPFYGLIKPGEAVDIVFYVKVPLEHAERMKEIAEKTGVVKVIFDIQFSALYYQGGASQKLPINLNPTFQFTIPKKTIEEWIAQWSSIYAYSVDLPKSVPREVLHDYIEALKAYNVGAYRAAVAMARRALQQAAEDTGAPKKDNLVNQIQWLFDQGFIDKATKNLADGVRYFGNYGAHPQDDLLAQVTQDNARLVIEILRQILVKLYGSK